MTQTSPGRFAWTAPTGRIHTAEPEPYDPLPDPVPRSDHDHHDLPAMTFDPPPTPPPGSPRRNKHGYLTQAAIHTAAHLRQRARERAGNTDPDPEPVTETETGPNPDDRFPEEPPF